MAVQLVLMPLEALVLFAAPHGSFSDVCCKVFVSFLSYKGLDYRSLSGNGNL